MYACLDALSAFLVPHLRRRARGERRAWNPADRVVEGPWAARMAPGPVGLASDLAWVLSGNGPHATVDTARLPDASQGGRACGQSAGEVDWSPAGLTLVSTGEREPIDRGFHPPFTKVGRAARDIPSYEGPAFFAPDGARRFVGDDGSVIAWCSDVMH